MLQCCYQEKLVNSFWFCNPLLSGHAGHSSLKLYMFLSSIYNSDSCCFKCVLLNDNDQHFITDVMPTVWTVLGYLHCIRLPNSWTSKKSSTCLYCVIGNNTGKTNIFLYCLVFMFQYLVSGKKSKSKMNLKKKS